MLMESATPPFEALALAAGSGVLLLHLVAAAPSARIVSHALLLRVQLCVRPDKARHLRIHVDKADSSGVSLASPAPARTIARLLASFLASPHFAARVAAAAPDLLSFHLFARSQPSYLFPGSSANPSKRVLSGADLVKWWARTVQLAVSSAFPLSDKLFSMHAVVPGESQAAVSRLCGNNWSYGFGPFAAPHMTASDVIPRFHDDPKTKALTLLPDPATATVQDLMRILPLTGECSDGQVCAIMAVCIENTNQFRQKCSDILQNQKEYPKNSDENLERKKSGEQELPESNESDADTEFDQFVDWMMVNTDFSSFEQAAESSRNILERIKLLSHVCAQKLSLDQTMDAKVKTTSFPPATSPLINNLQGSIKKKKRIGGAAESANESGKKAKC
ncbi:hypothetical protein HDU83_000297 [Entophlyctis luteolus]|nr:hypothetical protein HDU83_000297 [Entophlyctis luteolus]